MKNNLPATKEDLEKFITKKEFKTEVAKLATKEDLRQFATKEDLKNTDRSIRASLQLDFKDFRQEINEKLNLLPTKEEFFSKMDELIGELQVIREEHTVSSHQLSDHDNRISVLEQKAGIAVA